MWILVTECVGYHNQSKRFLYTPIYPKSRSTSDSIGLLLEMVKNKTDNNNKHFIT